VVSYRVMLDVPDELVRFVSGLLAARRREIGTRKGTRKLGCYRQALFGLAWFRDKGSIARLGAGFGLPQSTAYRYLDEVIGVLAARAPGLAGALERALAEGTPYVILDGKVVDSDRCREKTLSRKGTVIDLWYSGKAHDFGGNIQAVFYPDGIPMWVSDVLPGHVHDLAAARENVLAVLRPFLGAMPALADSGYEGAGHGVHVPVKKPAGVKELDINTWVPQLNARIVIRVWFLTCKNNPDSGTSRVSLGVPVHAGQQAARRARRLAVCRGQTRPYRHVSLMNPRLRRHVECRLPIRCARRLDRLTA
jgi:DDE superfamily endonuclease